MKPKKWLKKFFKQGKKFFTREGKVKDPAKKIQAKVESKLNPISLIKYALYEKYPNLGKVDALLKRLQNPTGYVTKTVMGALGKVPSKVRKAVQTHVKKQLKIYKSEERAKVKAKKLESQRLRKEAREEWRDIKRKVQKYEAQKTARQKYKAQQDRKAKEKETLRKRGERLDKQLKRENDRMLKELDRKYSKEIKKENQEARQLKRLQLREQREEVFKIMKGKHYRKDYADRLKARARLAYWEGDFKAMKQAKLDAEREAIIKGSKIVTKGETPKTVEGKYLADIELLIQGYGSEGVRNVLQWAKDQWELNPSMSFGEFVATQIDWGKSRLKNVPVEQIQHDLEYLDREYEREGLIDYGKIPDEEDEETYKASKKEMKEGLIDILEDMPEML